MYVCMYVCMYVLHEAHLFNLNALQTWPLLWRSPQLWRMPLTAAVKNLLILIRVHKFSKSFDFLYFCWTSYPRECHVCTRVCMCVCMYAYATCLFSSQVWKLFKKETTTYSITYAGYRKTKTYTMTPLDAGQVQPPAGWMRQDPQKNWKKVTLATG